MHSMTIVSVLYPRTATSHFDYDYYLQSHIPMVKARWSTMGLEQMSLLRGTAALDGSPPGFAMIAELQCTSREAVDEALAAHGAEVLGDIPNFTDVQPTIQISEVLEH